MTGVLLMPYIFGWFTLRKGYSVKARTVSMLWIAGYLIGFNPAVHDEIYNRTHTPAEQQARELRKFKERGDQAKVYAEMDAKDAAKKRARTSQADSTKTVVVSASINLCEGKSVYAQEAKLIDGQWMMSAMQPNDAQLVLNGNYSAMDGIEIGSGGCAIKAQLEGTVNGNSIRKVVYLYAR